MAISGRRREVLPDPEREGTNEKRKNAERGEKDNGYDFAVRDVLRDAVNHFVVRSLELRETPIAPYDRVELSGAQHQNNQNDCRPHTRRGK